ncbi:hypothetical protein [Burkholderia lata]|nr:hypothetical protein [Burkholderia lata]
MIEKGWQGFVASLRHPLVLLLVGFVLTNGLALRITNKLDEDRRHNDAVIRDHDQLRSSIDDLAASFDLYASASKHAMLALQSSSSDATLLQANRDYQAAYATWVQHRAIDTVSINQRLVGGSSGHVIIKIGDLVQLGTELLDNCVQSHFNDVSGIRVDKSADLRCSTSAPLPDFTIQSRLIALRLCMNYFTRSIRPHPRFDLGSEAGQNAMTELLLTGIDAICSPEKLVGIKMPLRDFPRNSRADPKLAG